MSAVLKPERNAEQAFFDTQQLPPEKRGVSFEAPVLSPAATGVQPHPR
jgi:hypothetical protein